MNELIYVYCITRNPVLQERFPEQTSIQSLRFGNFYVAVKYVSADEFSEENLHINISDVHWLESNARDHILVISRIMENSSVVPFKFGTIFLSESRLEKFIEDYTDSLETNFVYIDGKEEWTVKIYSDRKSLCTRIDELSEEASSLEKQIMASSPGKAFLLRRKKTDLVENEIDRLNKIYGQTYYDAFRKLSETARLNNLLPKDYTGREDTMILNATFLVNKEKVPDFVAIAGNMNETGAKTGCSVEATGPWPPFSFISIIEKL